MSITTRQVKNKRTADGGSSARAGTVYDVFIRYKTADGYKTYGKRGFLTKKEALAHEAEMRIKLSNPGFEPIKAAEAKQTVQEYLEEWVEIHGKAICAQAPLRDINATSKTILCRTSGMFL